ncbi:MAG TPA: S9 family peptidase [Thermoanaerobaculia bacterium]|nr:S9 family peptidase [Thermoanaerobaculia bacterium]
MSDAAIPLGDPEAPRPPRAARVPRIVSIHGRTVIDDYAWFRDRSNPDVHAWLEAEDAFAEAVMRPAGGLQEKLYGEMLGRIRETDVNVPWKMGDWLYYSRTEEGKQYSIFCRRREEPEGEEEVILDLNELASGKEYLSLGELDVSDDGSLLAYSLDYTGFRQYTLYVRDLASGRLLSDQLERVSSIAWAADGRTLYYVVEDEAKRPYRLYRHAIGGPADELLYEERDPLYRIWITRSGSRDYLFLTSASATTSEVRFLEARDPAGSFRLIEPRREDREYYVDHRGDRFWIITDDAGKNFRLVSAPRSSPGAESWTEVLPHREAVKIEEIEIFENHLVVIEREGGLDQFLVIDLRSGEQHRIGFREPVYSAAAGTNRHFETTRFRLAYESFVTPMTVYDYDMETRELKLLKQTDVLGGYDAGEYVSERLHARAADGTMIPISLVRRKDLDPAGRNPLLLYGYGAYGYPVPVIFSSNRLSLLDRGVVFAIAHVRGGGEMGKEWHDRGKMEWKQNTFTDFIAAAEHLIETERTSPEHLAIIGGSAGGLLVGAVLNMRPDLFRVAVAQVPFVDVVNTMLDASLPLTVGEYLEWGNPNIEAEFRRLESYDPYLNLAKRRYPAILVRTALNDSQVMYWEAAKYVARLRALKADDNPLLLKVNLGAGHSGASGRYDRLREDAFDVAFVLTQLGIWD